MPRFLADIGEEDRVTQWTFGERPDLPRAASGAPTIRVILSTADGTGVPELVPSHPAAPALNPCLNPNLNPYRSCLLCLMRLSLVLGERG